MTKIKKVGGNLAESILKNINKSEVMTFESLVSYSEGQIVSRTLVQNKGVSITLFAFAAGEEISTHSSKGDAIIHVLDGEGEITIGDDVFHPSKGEAIVMPANVPHAVKAKSPFKMMLVVVFP